MLNDASREGLADIYSGTDLQVLYEPETSIADVSLRVNSARVRGETNAPFREIARIPGD